MIDSFHLVFSIHPTSQGYTLNCRCSVKLFEETDKFICKGETSCECRVLKSTQKGDVVDYQVELPQLMDGNFLFFAVLKNGEKKGVWKPDNKLTLSSLPAGFHFQSIYLNLMFIGTKTSGSTADSAGNFSVVFTGIWRNQSNLFFSGYVFLSSNKSSIDSIKLKLVKLREENTQSSHEVSVLPVEKDVFGTFKPELYLRYRGEEVYKIECKVNMDHIKHFYGYFNLFIEHNNTLATPYNYYQKLADKDHCFPVRLSSWKRALFVPFHNEFFNKWRLDIYHLNLYEWFKLKRLKKRCSTRPPKKSNNVWLVGEYTNTARDNGMHFYNYLCRKKSKVKAYYVIYKGASKRRLLFKRNIVYYGSYRHFKIAAQAGVLVFSHMPEFLLPKSELIVRYRQKLSQFKTIFIQHGVIATTAIALIYEKKRRKFDRFVVSSSFEKKNICSHLGYNDQEVIVTGLARWDNLLAASQKSRDILVMPTYRNDLDNVSEDEFKQSNYFRFWSTLLSSAKLLSFVEERGLTIKFFLHIGLARFSHCFDFSPGVQQANDKDIQQLLSTCGLMVTDYSSVAFDVLIQNKPVIFCPFDYAAMMELRRGPQFINYEKDLPGPVCYDEETTVSEIVKHVEDDFTIDPKYQDRRNKFFNFIDNKNCDRLYGEIESFVKK